MQVVANQKYISVLFVCLGNICRSPTAEAVFQNKIEKAGFGDCVKVDSAGTSGWHVDSPPDTRTIRAASVRGYDMTSLRGREVTNEDFRCFDHIFAMDKNNLAHLNRMYSQLSKHSSIDSEKIAKPNLFLDLVDQNIREVPDPYHGGSDGFEHVLDLIEKASDVLLKEVAKELCA